MKPEGMVNWHPLGSIWHPLEGLGIKSFLEYQHIHIRSIFVSLNMMDLDLLFFEFFSWENFPQDLGTLELRQLPHLGRCAGPLKKKKNLGLKTGWDGNPTENGAHAIKLPIFWGSCFF